jgi:CHAT domain-containing protein
VSRERWLWLLLLAAGLGTAVLLASGVAGPETAPRTTSSGVLDFFATDAEHDLLERLTAEERDAEAFDLASGILESRAARFGYDDPRTLASLQWTAAIASLAGERRTAEELFQALLDRRARTLDGADPRLAEAYLRRAKAARLLDRFPQAAGLFAAARRVLRRSGSPPGLAPLQAALEQGEAGMLLRLDLNGAAEGFRRAAAMRRGLSPVPALQLSESLVWLGWTLDRLGLPDEAAPYLAEARDRLEGLDRLDPSLRATAAQLRADALLASGRLDEAETLYRSEAALQRRARSLLPGGFARRVSPLDGYEPLALQALLRGDGSGAWRLMEEGRAPMTRDLIRLGMASRAGDRRGDDFAEQGRGLLEVKRRRDLLLRAGDDGWSAASYGLTLECLRRRARLGLLEARRLLLEEENAPAPSLEATQALLRPEDALLGWLEVDVGGAPSSVSQPRRSWGWLYVLRRTGPVRWVPLWDGTLPPAYETERAGWGPVRMRLQRAAEWPLRVDADPALLRDLRGWAAVYFDPARPYLSGVDRILVEGTGMPIEALPDGEGRFVLDRFEVVYVPSAAILALLTGPDGRTRRPGRGKGLPPSALLAVAASGDKLGEAPERTSGGEGSGGDALLRLALADPHREVRRTRTSFTRDEVPLDRLPHLRFAGLESGAVARRFRRATVIQGGDDVERRLDDFVDRGGLREVDVVHVAGHTLLDPAPERSGLALGERPPAPGGIDDQVLDAEEVLRGWRLEGALFTLSACESARSAGVSRGEDLGLTPALFAAGARRILVSLWTVDDRATAILMDRFYDRLIAGSPPAAALADAKRFLRDLQDGTGRRPFEHPAYWAGFILIGAP